jgi:hypothetical protein
MAILQPFADYLKLTVPVGEAPFLRDRLESIIIESGGHELRPGLFRVGERGTVKFGDWGKVGTVGVSGDALAALRGAKLFLPFLSAIAECPHRITQVDLAVDVVQDAAPIVAKLYRQGVAGEVQLTRKGLKGSQVKRIGRAGLADGKETGTVYLGSRKSAVCARVYDKRDEVLCRAVEQHGTHPSVIELNDPGPLTRYEVTIGRKVGATLRDVVEPAPLFWKYASGLLRAPAGVPEWESHAIGFELPKHEPNPAFQLELLLESSPDVRRVARLAGVLHGVDAAEVLRALRGYLLQMRGPVRA